MKGLNGLKGLTRLKGLKASGFEDRLVSPRLVALSLFNYHFNDNRT